MANLKVDRELRARSILDMPARRFLLRSEGSFSRLRRLASGRATLLVMALMGNVKRICAVAFVVLCGMDATAHPHVFVESDLLFNCDSTSGCKEVQVTLRFDSMYSRILTGEVDTNKDDVISPDEQKLLLIASKKPMEDLVVNTGRLRINGKDTQFPAYRDFVPSITNGKAIFKFVLPLMDEDEEQELIRDVYLIFYDDYYYFKVGFDSSRVSFNGCDEFKVNCNVANSKDISIYMGSIYPQEVRVKLDKKSNKMTAAEIAKMDPKTRELWYAVEEYDKEYEAENGHQNKTVAKNGENRSDQMNFLERIYTFQMWLKEKIQTATEGVRKSGNIMFLLVMLGCAMLYGIADAAGPGHGKLIVSTCMLTMNYKFTYILFLSFYFSLLHSSSGLVLITIVYLVLNKTLMATMEASGGNTQFIGSAISFSLIVIVGCIFLYKAIKGFKEEDHDHDHGLESELIKKQKMPILVISLLGLIPCPATVVIMIFAIEVKAISLGLLMVAVQAFGAGLTIATISTLVFFSKELSMKITGAKWTHMLDNVMKVVGALLMIAFASLFLVGSLHQLKII